MNTYEISSLKGELIEALQLNAKITAIKAIRSLTGGGLCESKAIVDAIYAVFPQPVSLQDEQPQYIVAVQADYETWTNIFNCEQSAMDYAEGHTPKENVTVGRVIAKSVAKTTYTLEKV